MTRASAGAVGAGAGDTNDPLSERQRLRADDPGGPRPAVMAMTTITLVMLGPSTADRTTASTRVGST